MAIEVHINGALKRIEAAPETMLLGILRDSLGLTGAKYGCGEGECGACTVLVDGRAFRSCVTALGDVAGRELTTIEGLAGNGRLHVVQQAFLDKGALQCGYCAPGMILGAISLLNSDPRPAADDIARGMEGHICRCGVYPRIVEAIQLAAARRAIAEGK